MQVEWQFCANLTGLLNIWYSLLETAYFADPNTVRDIEGASLLQMLYVRDFTNSLIWVNSGDLPPTRSLCVRLEVTLTGPCTAPNAISGVSPNRAPPHRRDKLGIGQFL